MILIIEYLTLFLLSMKLLWNILTPIAVIQRHKAWESTGGQKPGAISMAPIVEIALVVVLTATSSITDRGLFGFNYPRVLLAGVFAIISSYLLAFLLGALINMARR
jgi:hypothetical protein